MAYCTKCGQMIEQGAAFCVGCGAPVEAKTSVSVIPVSQEKWNQEEQEFLDNTHRLLVWERKAWSIASKAFLISGIIMAALFMLSFLIGIAAIIDGDRFAGIIGMVMGYVYGAAIGGMFIAFGIISKKACGKLPQYIDTVYSDLSLAYNRCGSIGMLVFTVLFGVVSPIFFIINFVRMKVNRALIEGIIRKQKG